MTRTLRYLFILLFVSVAGTAFAQSQMGSIQGTVLDDKKEPVVNAAVQVMEGGILKGGAVTDYDGNYEVKPLSPGRYDVKVQLQSYKTSITTGVIVSPDKITGVNFSMELASKQLNEVVITGYKVPLVDRYSPGGQKAITGDQIDKMPTRSTAEVASTAPGVYQKGGSSSINIGGGRSDATKYIVDGVVVYNQRGVNMSQGVIDQIQVYTSGLPAKFGDAIGGVINITTRGISEKYRGSALVEHSVDGYNHNLASFNISGPLYSKKNADGTKKPIIGFLAAIDGWYDGDRRPTYGGNYVIKDDARQRLIDNPLHLNVTQGGTATFRPSSEYLTANDFELQKIRPSAAIAEGRANFKLDFQVAENLNLTVGAMGDYTKSSRYNSDPNGFRQWSYLDGADIPDETNFTGRGFVRLTQRFGKPMTGGAEEKKPLVSNAYYTVQVDYQKDYFNRQDAKLKKNLFEYGYQGKYLTDYTSSYNVGVDDSTQRLGVRLISDHLATQTRFERSEINPTLANYSSEIFNQLGTVGGDVNTIKFIGGIINGQLPNLTYSTSALNAPNWTSIGYQQGYYQYSNTDQVSVSVDASFDFQPGKTKHAIEFGLYYQQQAMRYYSASAAAISGDLWQYMRQLTNSHIGLSGTPTFVINGQHYTMDDVRSGRVTPSPTDTILYERTANAAAQTTFDKNLRAKLGAGATQYINIDALDPSTYSLKMFSADELLNSGNSYVNYAGYDYTGKRLNGQVNFNDFFTQKDANGNYTRNIGAYRPNYIAGYILDKFQFKDMLFNIGVRVDRFDANTKVLKDPYSLYEVKTVGNSNAVNLLNGKVTPANIGSNYVVYVNSNESTTPSVVGYRNGDDWYDYTGKKIEDPSVLRNYTGGRDPQPLLVDGKTKISDTNYNPNTSFTDYKPQVNVMPRISFSFPISDVALFYAHYDVIVQRPSVTYSEIYATPADYLFLAQKQSGIIINNPDLKPERKFDYEVGFQQTLSPKSAVTISAFYTERKDMVQIRPYLFAYPITYYTFGNRDFSTTKGMTLKYELRRTGNIRLDIAYTLQFAEGTGSSANSGNGGSSTFVSGHGLLQNFIAAGLPSLRYTVPMDYDSRHMIVTTADYRYDENEGPVVGGKHILQNAGVNLIFRARSGEPYTRYLLPNSNIVAGELQGSRLPWHFGLDLKVDKDFALSFGKKPAEGAAPKKPLYLNAYVLIQNVLNIKEILSVNGYTGRPDDDGYLTSAQGMQDVQKQSSALSYVDLYNINMYNPQNFNLPRRLSIGLQFSF